MRSNFNSISFCFVHFVISMWNEKLCMWLRHIENMKHEMNRRFCLSIQSSVRWQSNDSSAAIVANEMKKEKNGEKNRNRRTMWCDDANVLAPPRLLISADQNKSTCSPTNQICAKWTTIPLLFSWCRADGVRTRRESCTAPVSARWIVFNVLNVAACVCVYVCLAVRESCTKERRTAARETFKSNNDVRRFAIDFALELYSLWAKTRRGLWIYDVEWRSILNDSFLIEWD